PALCATLLRPADAGHSHQKGFFGWFNRLFDAGTRSYHRAVNNVLVRRGRYMLVFVLIVGGLAVLFTRLPSAFLAQEDQGLMFVHAQLPGNASAERTEQVLTEIRDYLLNEESGVVSSVYTVNGF